MRARFIVALAILLFLAAMGFALAAGTSSVQTTTTVINGKTVTISEETPDPRTVTIKGAGKTRTVVVPGETRFVPGQTVTLRGQTTTRVTTIPGKTRTVKTPAEISTVTRTVTTTRVQTVPGPTTTVPGPMQIVTQTVTVENGGGPSCPKPSGNPNCP